MKHEQGGHGTEKTMDLDAHFPDRETREIRLKVLKSCFYTGNLPATLGKF